MTDYPVINNAKGLLLALPRHLLPDGTFFVSDNMSLYQGVLQPVDGYSLFSASALDSYPLLLDSFDRPDGVNRLIAVSHAKLYYYDLTTDTWIELARLLDPPPNGPVLTVFAAGGSLANGTYNVRYTYNSASGETTPSPVTLSGAVTGPNGRITVTFPALPPDVLSRNVYAKNSGAGGQELQVGTGITVLTFDVTVVPGGATYPASNSAADLYTSADNDFFTADFGPNPATPFICYIFTNNKDAVQFWSTDIARARSLGGAATDSGQHFSASIAEFYNSIFHLNRLESGVRNPRLIRWSDAGLPETYAGGVSGNITLFQGPDQGAGVRLEPLTGYLAAYRDKAIHLLNFVGSPFFFAQRQVIMGRGLLARRALVNLGSKHIFLGTDNVYVFNGVDLQSIGDDIRDQLYASLNYNTVNRSIMLYRTDRNEVQLCVPTIGGLGNPDTWWLWNITTESWSGPIKSREVTAGCEHQFFSLTWDDVTGSWNSQSATWDTVPAAKVRPRQVFGNSATTVFLTMSSTTQALGVNVTARWESRSFNPGSEQSPTSVEMICTDILPLGLVDSSVRWYVGTSDSPVGPFTFVGPFTIGVRGLVKTMPHRGKWFVIAAEMESAHTIAGFIATFEPGWTFAPTGR